MLGSQSIFHPRPAKFHRLARHLPPSAVDVLPPHVGHFTRTLRALSTFKTLKTDRGTGFVTGSLTGPLAG
jgi:hypothetical protein